MEWKLRVNSMFSECCATLRHHRVKDGHSAQLEDDEKDNNGKSSKNNNNNNRGSIIKHIRSRRVRDGSSFSPRQVSLVLKGGHDFTSLLNNE